MSLSKMNGGMGFRDMEKFNLALFGKQCWRLLTTKESLASRVLKAKNYPHCSFMESRLGSNPSFTWRSLWCAKFLMERGDRWRVSNGQCKNPV
ncbi:hypothetical protein REPUB_Repub01dG0227900 [Reevesia pubescens]